MPKWTIAAALAMGMWTVNTVVLWAAPISSHRLEPCSIFLHGSTSREKVKVKADDKTELDDCEEGEGKDRWQWAKTKVEDEPGFNERT
jgi:hypothetical protein